MLDPRTFEVVLANELKRALRSQNFVTLVLMEPRGGDLTVTLPEIAGLVGGELRETDVLAVDGATVWMVLLDADAQNSARAIERVMARLEHYQFTTPVEIAVGAACCPTDGAEVDTLKRAAAAARNGLTRRKPRGTAHAQ
jgi:hypothetical protein